ncbi:hypothetical protein [Mariniblastus fucicola]|uniref:Uncharacterized protein n=1 Tax=Mariniblastus fucicola TaxID=980251 RepID=A0A5B9PAK4_9BACT|nr:hypothetical protein [Mariniblastus fucicola]QEG22255.1 hypothetical protein MFFC18_21310 [Mariniblastus fucicola]
MLTDDTLIAATERNTSDSAALLIVILVVAMIGKTFILRKFEKDRAITTFAILIAASTLILWLIYPDPQSQHVEPAVKYVGLPVLVFGVPVISFLSYILTDTKPISFSIQDFAEILFIPVWFVLCNAIMFALNWIWI